jgi:hypothetical protein
MGCCSYKQLPKSEYFESNEQINIYFNEKNDLIYEPLKEIRRIGIIIYPGLTLVTKGYADIAFSLAQNGYFSVLCKMPCNTAAFAPSRAADIAERYETKVDKWVLGGHSLGKFRLI